MDHGFRGPLCSKSCAGQYTGSNTYADIGPVAVLYYNIEKGGETVADYCRRNGIRLLSEAELMAAVPLRPPRTKQEKPKRPCELCGKATENKRFCSPACAGRAVRMTRPAKEELERLVWKQPATKVAKALGVSDVTVANWCRQYGIEKPPQGYWLKKR